MIDTLRIALAQVNPTVGDLSGNAELVRLWTERARDAGAQVVAFPELVLTGYPPEDLLFKTSFLDENVACLRELAALSHDITMVVGFVDVSEDIHNAAAVLHGGEVRGVYHKMFLPTYGVFDEDRYFQRGQESYVYELGGAGIGVNICEDVWYPSGPTGRQGLAGAEVILNISASPYRRGVPEYRSRMLATRAQDHTAFMCFTNMVGGQDELVFDGSSAIYGPDGNLIARAPAFKEALVVTDLEASSVFRRRLHDPRGRKLSAEVELGRAAQKVVLGDPLRPAPQDRLVPQVRPALEPAAEVYEALTLALRDYVAKTGFQKVLVALSGGVDSSLVAAIAVDALGAENVIGVSMPSRYSSEGSKTDAQALADNLGMVMHTVPIEQPFAAFLDVLEEQFAGTTPGLAEENLQARCRANILMSLSNKFPWLVATTGNKSELAVGYSTLYGDLAGGFALIKDVPKGLVYELCRYRNALGPAVPESVLTKPPSAELRPDQKDEDSLPPYPVLDEILQAYVERDHSVDEIVKMGFDREIVIKVVRLVDLAEYKRRQAPPGPKVSPRAFGRDRRLPIVNHYRYT